MAAQLTHGRTERAGLLLTTKYMARSLGAMFVAGSTLALAWLALAPPGLGRVSWLRAAIGIGFLFAAGLLFGLADRFAPRGFHFLIGVTLILVVVAYLGGGETGGELLLGFLWVTPYAALFFTRRAAVAHTVWAALLLAGALAYQSVPLRRGTAIWLATMGTVSAVSVLVGAVAESMRRRDRELWRQVTHDVLTGLPNRRMFSDKATQAIADRAEGDTVAVLLIDLDRFKVINDTHGHQAGDDLLANLAPRMRALVRAEDWVARFGGDEFAVLVRREGRFDLEALAERIAQAWSLPLDTDSGRVFTSGCIGIAVASRADDTAQRLLRDADSALYRAKALGPGNYQIFDEQMRDGAEHRLRLERDLRDAIARGQLHVAYQPVLDLRTGCLASVEALCRWNHPELGAISPAEFIPLAEDAALIVSIGRWVLEETVRQLAQWRAAYNVPSTFAAAVNVSSAQLRDGFAQSVRKALDEHDVPASQLTVELTESSVIGVREETAQEIQRLRELGVRLLLDDFGTGYSSLSYLQNIPLYGLKIDQSFIARISETSDAPIVEAIIRMAATLGLRTVAEGIETEVQRDRVRALGCDFGQGYLFARPAGPEPIAARFQTSAVV